LDQAGVFNFCSSSSVTSKAAPAVKLKRNRVLLIMKTAITGDVCLDTESDCDDLIDGLAAALSEDEQPMPPADARPATADGGANSANYK
jgi:hypothetical protein